MLQASQVATPTILVVEDDPLVRDMAVTLLEEAGLRVIEAESADGALASLREYGGEVAVVFTDVRMPGSMDGIDLAHAVERSWPRIKLLVTSGFTGRPHEDLPASAIFVPKPWRPLELLGQLERMTGLRPSA